MSKFNYKKPNCVVYLDHAAACPPLEEMLTVSQEFATDYFYNPGAIYDGGRQTKMAISRARSDLAGYLNVNSNSLVFTAGATEANNLIIKGFRQANNCRVAGLTIDHSSLTNNVDKLLDINKKTGFVKLAQIASLEDDIGLLSLSGINSQLGVIQPFAKLKRVVRDLNQSRQQRRVPDLKIHVDASQMGFVHKLDPAAIKADLVTYNSGKIGGPKQAGFFYCCLGINLKPVLKGGGQEKKLRPGTESIGQIYGTLTAFRRAIANQPQLKDRFRQLQNYFEGKLKQLGVEIVLESSQRSPQIITCLLPTSDAERVVLNLSRFGIYIGLGSACQTINGDRLLSESALTKLDLTEQQIRSSCRFSFGPSTTIDQLDKTIAKLKLAI